MVAPLIVTEPFPRALGPSVAFVHQVGFPAFVVPGQYFEVVFFAVVSPSVDFKSQARSHCSL